MSGGPYDDVVARLQDIAAEIDERAFDQLRHASAERTGRPADDKRLMQARRAIEKAARLLAGTADDD